MNEEQKKQQIHPGTPIETIEGCWKRISLNNGQQADMID